MSDTVNGFSGADWVGRLAGSTDRVWAGVTNTETSVLVAAGDIGVVNTNWPTARAVVVATGAGVAVVDVVLRNAFLLL